MDGRADEHELPDAHVRATLRRRSAFVFLQQEHILVGMKHKAYYCVQTMDKPSLWRFHEVYMLLLILVIPTGIMIVAYGSISWEIWHVMQRRYDMTSGQA
jgi:hypothetical protein